MRFVGNLILSTSREFYSNDANIMTYLEQGQSVQHFAHQCLNSPSVKQHCELRESEQVHFKKQTHLNFKHYCFLFKILSKFISSWANTPTRTHKIIHCCYRCISR